MPSLAVNMWCRAVVLCCVVAVALGAVARGDLYKKPDEYKDQEGCYIPDLEAVVPYDETAPARDSCMQYRCHTDEIIYELCGVVEPGSGMKKVEDTSQPYPGCCPILVPDTY